MGTGNCHAAIQRATGQLRQKALNGGGTALRDAIKAGITVLLDSLSRDPPSPYTPCTPQLLVMSDGQDGSFSTSMEELQKLVKRAKAQYPQFQLMIMGAEGSDAGYLKELCRITSSEFINLGQAQAEDIQKGFGKAKGLM